MYKPGNVEATLTADVIMETVKESEIPEFLKNEVP
jgi:hypothetical protein